jgi:hypothetical protein
MKNYRIRGRAASHFSRLRTGKAAVALTAVFVAAALLLPTAIVTTPAAAASLAPPLTRYPYLTDVVGSNATVNFGTNQSKVSAVVKWGQAGAEACTAHSTTATKTNLSVNGVGEYQWKAQLSPLLPDTAYCYRIYFGTSQIDLLGSDPAPQFVTQLPVGSAKPISFAVLGDWGKTYASGNPDQANVMAQIAAAAPLRGRHRRYRLPGGKPEELRRSRANGAGHQRCLRASVLDRGGQVHPDVQLGRQPCAYDYLPHQLAVGCRRGGFGRAVPDGFLLLRRRDHHEELRERLVRL